MEETKMEDFKKKLLNEISELPDQVHAAYEKAQHDGQTDPKIAFKDLIGLKIGNYDKEE